MPFQSILLFGQVIDLFFVIKNLGDCIFDPVFVAVENHLVGHKLPVVPVRISTVK